MAKPFDSNVAEITNVISAGPITVAGVDFIIVEAGDTYTIEIPAANAIYTHMLGEKVHSILASVEHMDATIATLKEYQAKQYGLILSGHSTPEYQNALATKIAYIEKAKELAGTTKSADEFIAAMKAAYPDYAGENYLTMTAGYLFPAK